MTITDSTINVLVTGVGAIIGQGIIKSLRASSYKVRVIGADKSNQSHGVFLCDTFYQKPLCSESDIKYLNFWRDLIQEENVNIVMLGLEIDMHFFKEHRVFFQELGVVIALNTNELITLSEDKWFLGKSLERNGIVNIPTLINASWNEAILALGPPPVLLKPRRGNGSRGVYKVHNQQDFEYAKKVSVDNWMLQKIVGDDASEFTVGVFGLGDGTSVKPITFRRRLSNAGNTVQAEVVNDNAIDHMSNLLTQTYKPLGPTNYQFRKEKDTVYLLEINPRFSSSNSLRTAFGYNESEMAIDFYLFNKCPMQPNIKNGIAWRYSEDYIKYDSNTI